jgi:hypothetical protein
MGEDTTEVKQIQVKKTSKKAPRDLDMRTPSGKAMKY